MTLAVACMLLAPVSGLQLSKTTTSNMVVPADGPTFTGWAETAGTEVSVRATDTNETVTVTAGADKKWTARLAGREASLTPFAVAISEKGEAAVMLTNLLAGDVWVCSGQSNMEFSVAAMLDRDEIISTAGDQPGIRLFAVQKNASKGVEVEDVIDSQYAGGWVEASTQTICGDEYGERADYCEEHCSKAVANKTQQRPTWGYFSAACYRHGLEVLRKTGRPQGLVESCWGGTRIEQWSSTAASAKCNSDPALGGLWAGMIVPLLDIPITGVLWFQGESNSRTIASSNKYACQLQALIQDWRARFAVLHNATPFAWMTYQLAAVGDSSGGALRLAEEASLQLPRTGMAVAIDLFDPTSPCASVHFRNKTAAAVRLAQASLDIVYGQSTAWTGPLAGPIDLSTNGELTVHYNATGRLSFITVPLQVKKGSLQNFQVTADANLTSGWVQAPAVLASGNSVTVNASLVGSVAGVRYGWGSVPYGEFLYDGELIPARPFLARCNNGACALIRGGEVPDDKVLYPEVEGA